MIRLAYWLIGSLLLTAGIAWLIGLPGTLTVELLGYRMQPRLGVAAFGLIAAVALVILTWGVVKRVVAAPFYFARRNQERRRDQGYLALSDGFIALQSGDALRARQLAREARNNLPKNGAAQLLEARADLALGEMHSARENYRALLSNRKTALAALAGLYDQARAQGRIEAALTFAQKALDLSPQVGWARDALFHELTRNGRWEEAARMVESEPSLTRDDKMRKRRRMAVVDTARAQLKETQDPSVALDHALAALKLQPDFVPAALIAARIYANRGDSKRAMTLLRRVWRATSHPDVAMLYANAVQGAPATERLKRIRELVDAPPANKAGALVLARAAIDAFEWGEARAALSGFIGTEPSQAVCLMMAEIEEGETSDHGKARDWWNRAQRAPRDPVWTADGITAPEWEPVSPVTGLLDAFEWRVPTSAIAARTAQAGTGATTAPGGPAQAVAPETLPLADTGSTAITLRDN